MKSKQEIELNPTQIMRNINSRGTLNYGPIKEHKFGHLSRFCSEECLKYSGWSFIINDTSMKVIPTQKYFKAHKPPHEKPWIKFNLCCRKKKCVKND